MANAAPDKIETIITPVSFEYTYTAGTASTTFLQGLKEGRIVGQRCPDCANVYVPPRGACPRCGVPTEGEVAVADTGTLTTFTVVHIPIPGSPVKPPFIAAIILLDGADQTTLHLVAGCDPAEARIGMRLRAVWKPREEWEYSFGNILYFEPSGEPDVPFEELRVVY